MLEGKSIYDSKMINNLFFANIMDKKTIKIKISVFIIQY